MSIVEDIVAQKIKSRAEFGLQKYGISVADEQLSFIEWLNHQQQELMDACVYIEKKIIMLELLASNDPELFNLINDSANGIDKHGDNNEQ